MDKIKLPETLQCVQCGVKYDPLKNLGRWECSMHVGKLAVLNDVQSQISPGRYKCCNRIPEDNGCIKCDHRSNFDVNWLDQPTDIYTLEEFNVIGLHCPDKAIKWLENGSMVEITRCEIK